eukprot:tig00000553_g2095.t1
MEHRRPRRRAQPGRRDHAPLAFSAAANSADGLREVKRAVAEAQQRAGRALASAARGAMERRPRLSFGRPAMALGLPAFQAATSSAGEASRPCGNAAECAQFEKLQREELLTKLRLAEGEKQFGAIPGWQAFSISFLAPMLASSLTIPLDVSRTRMQLQGDVAGGSPRIYANAIDCIYQIAKHEGVKGLTRGMPVQVLRETTVNVFKLGLYDPILRVVNRGGHTDGKHAPIAKRLVAGALCGAIGSFAANPLDIVKTRTQAAGEQPPSAVYVVKHVVKSQGAKALWKGAVPNMASTAVSSAVMLTAYSTARDFLKGKIVEEGPRLDITCSLVGAVLSTIVINPLVVVKTRVHATLKKAGAALAPLAVAQDILSREGALGFFKGTSAALLMRVPNQILIFSFLEKMRRALKKRAETKDQADRLRALFDRLDIDKSGAIDAMELLLAYVAATPRTPAQSDAEVVRAAMESAEAMMRRADKDGDRQMSYPEFLAVAPELEKMAQRSLRLAAFRAIDADHNGTLSPADLEDAVHRLAPLSASHLPPDEYESLVRVGVRELLRKADTNGDGRISFEEFDAVVDGMHELRDARGLAAWARSRALTAN